MRGRGAAEPKPTRVFRAASGTVTLIVSAAVAIVLLGDAVVRAGWAETLLLAPWVLLALWVLYVVLYASAIEVDGAGVTVQNLLRRTRVPWGAVTDIRLRYQVVFTHGAGRELKAFGGPVAGRSGGAADRRREPPALRELDDIRRAWEDAVAAGAAGGATQRSWDVPAVVAVALLIAWAVVALLITGGPA